MSGLWRSSQTCCYRCWAFCSAAGDNEPVSITLTRRRLRCAITAASAGIKPSPAWRHAATSMGWFFGFKLHLVFNHLNEIVAVKLTPGNVHDGAPVEQLTQHLTGKLFGDKGYLGKKRAAALLKRGLVLMTKVRKNMRALPLTPTDKLLLNARNMAETIIGHLKAFSSLNLPKLRAPLNAFLHLLAALTAYQLNPIKPAASCFPLLSLPA